MSRTWFGVVLSSRASIVLNVSSLAVFTVERGWMPRPDGPLRDALPARELGQVGTWWPFVHDNWQGVIEPLNSSRRSRLFLLHAERVPLCGLSQ